MFYAHFITPHGVHVTNLYDTPSEYFNGTFSPYTEIVAVIPFEIRGKTYAERKENFRMLVLDFMTADAEAQGGLSYYEWALIGNYFKKNAKRYGLIDEFKENGIPC